MHYAPRLKRNLARKKRKKRDSRLKSFGKSRGCVRIWASRGAMLVRRGTSASRVGRLPLPWPPRASTRTSPRTTSWGRTPAATHKPCSTSKIRPRRWAASEKCKTRLPGSPRPPKCSKRTNRRRQSARSPETTRASRSRSQLAASFPRRTDPCRRVAPVTPRTREPQQRTRRTQRWPNCPRWSKACWPSRRSSKTRLRSRAMSFRSSRTAPFHAPIRSKKRRSAFAKTPAQASIDRPSCSGRTQKQTLRNRSTIPRN